jgi:hypothetical protein
MPRPTTPPTPPSAPPSAPRQMPLPLPPTQGPAPPRLPPDLAELPSHRIWSTLAPSLQGRVRMTLVQVAREVLAHDARRGQNHPAPV